jgi:hypothetical protein
VLLLDDCGCGTAPNRVPAGTSPWSKAVAADSTADALRSRSNEGGTGCAFDAPLPGISAGGSTGRLTFGGQRKRPRSRENARKGLPSLPFLTGGRRGPPAGQAARESARRPPAARSAGRHARSGRPAARGWPPPGAWSRRHGRAPRPWPSGPGAGPSALSAAAARRPGRSASAPRTAPRRCGGGACARSPAAACPSPASDPARASRPRRFSP